jgi:uncharacterized protein (TIGR02594 family)
MNWEPEWLVIARGEIGQKEVSGTEHNSRIVEYHKTTTLPESLYNDETAWCSSFVNWCFRQAGYVGTNSARAKDWKKWGKLYEKPIYGSVAIIDYGVTDEGVDKGGHVGFVIGRTSRGAIVILGGNQGKTDKGSVNEIPFGSKDVVGYVVPADFDAVSYELPVIVTNEQEGSYETTR